MALGGRGGRGVRGFEFFLYSKRNAINGSTRVARRAGRYAAAPATVSKVSVAAAIVVGSVGLKPYRNAPIARVDIHASGMPIARPVSTITRLCRSTIASTAAR